MNNNSIVSFYSHKTVFITGATGFVGKVIVEKLIRTVPAIRKIFVLIRPQKQSTSATNTSTTTSVMDRVNERCRKQIIESPIFDFLYQSQFSHQSKEQFFQYLQSKIVAVPGDVTFTKQNSKQISDDALILDASMQQLVQTETDIIIHSAASISFFDRLDQAIRLNTFGTLKVFHFAQTCSKPIIFCHISTSYVNCNQPSGSFIEEKVYPLHLPQGEPVLSFCNRMLTLSEPQIDSLSQTMLHTLHFPNTYTFTKNMTERLLLEQSSRSNNNTTVTMVIVRPSIIGSSYREPFPGWVDTLSASGSMFFMVGMGIITVTYGNDQCIADQIPVDYVANMTLLAIYGRKHKQVYHAGTSHRNPVDWHTTQDAMKKYWESHKPSKAIRDTRFRLTDSKFLYHLQFFLEYTVPSRAYQLLGLLSKSKTHVKTGKLLSKIENRTLQLNQGFEHFIKNQWIFDTSQLDSIVATDLSLFDCDTTKIDWRYYMKLFCYGIQKHVMNEDVPNTMLPTQEDITKRDSVDWFADINAAYTAQGKFRNQTTREEMKQVVLRSQQVVKAMETEALTLNKKLIQVEERAKQIMDVMFADPQIRTVRMLAWFFKKIWRILYESVVVDEYEIAQVKQKIKSTQQQQHPLIIIPTHRSYIDFLIMQYLFFIYGLPIPHIAAGEDFLNMFIVKDLFRHSGAFFIRRQFGEDALYKSIFFEYVHAILMEGSPLEFFVEGTRSRAGKTLQPKMGLLKMILDAYMEDKITNISFLPIHIAYEKLIEGDAYVNELLGEKKKRESLKNLIKARNILYKKYGQINVSFANTIDLKQFIESNQLHPKENQEHYKLLVQLLGYRIAYDLNQSSILMPTNLIASILLTNRNHNGYTMDELQSKYNWLKEMVIQRGGKIHSSNNVEESLQLLDNLIKRRRFMIEPNIQGRRDARNLMQLSVYRNSIIYLFIQECIIAVCSDVTTEREEWMKWILLLSKVMSNEFIFKSSCQVDSDKARVKEFETTLQQLKEWNILQIENGGYYFKEEYQDYLEFVKSLLYPFVECYWICLLSFLSNSNMLSIRLMNQFIYSTNNEYPTYNEELKQCIKSIEGLEEAKCLAKIQWLADKLFVEAKSNYYESCSMDTIKNALTTFLQMNILKRVKKGKTMVIQIDRDDLFFDLLCKLDRLHKCSMVVMEHSGIISAATNVLVQTSNQYIPYYQQPSSSPQSSQQSSPQSSSLQRNTTALVPSTLESYKVVKKQKHLQPLVEEEPPLFSKM